MAIQAPGIIRDKETAKLRSGIEMSATGKVKFEDMGMVNLGWGEIHNPIKNTDSVVPETAPKILPTLVPFSLPYFF